LAAAEAAVTAVGYCSNSISSSIACHLLRSCFDQKPTEKKNRRTLVAKIETQMAAVWQQLPLPDRLTIFMLGENQTKFLIKLLPHLAIRP